MPTDLWVFSTQNANMSNIVNLIRLKWCIHLSRSFFFYIYNSFVLTTKSGEVFTGSATVFISLITNVSFLLANWLKMHKMRCIRQVNKNISLFLHNFIEIIILAFWVFGWTEKSRNINGNERWQKTTVNIHIFLMECTRKFKFGMIIYHYLVLNSFGYSMMPYDLDRNFQGHWYRV